MIDYPEDMPCWAPGAAEYLEEALTGDEVAWEWGGGASSMWLGPKVHRLFVIEHDPEWVRKLTFAKNTCVFQRGKLTKGYVNWVTEGNWDPTLWLIDGYQRIDCLNLVCKLVKDGDLVVLDDALDYGEFLLKQSSWTISRFAQPHPHAGIPINHKKYGHLRNTVRKVHADTKETWVCQV